MKTYTVQADAPERESSLFCYDREWDARWKFAGLIGYMPKGTRVYQIESDADGSRVVDFYEIKE